MGRKPQNKLREAIPIPPPAPLPEPEIIDFGGIFNEYASGAIDLIVVLGPTASGKTRYAVDLARRCGGEILSADSRQVYRGMDIGTGKDLNEYGDVPYHLIDIVPAGTRFDLYQGTDLWYESNYNYTANGKMQQKQTHSRKLNNTLGIHDIHTAYTYNYNNDQPNTIESIYDEESGLSKYYKWDGKGNMTYRYDEQNKTNTKMCWTEDNRMQAYVQIG